MDLISSLTAAADAIAGFLVSPGGRLWPLYLGTMALIAFGLWWRRKPGPGFLAWAFPRAMYVSRSTWVDLQLFLLGRALATLGLVNAVVGAALVAGLVGEALGGLSTGLVLPGWAYALLILVAADFAVYWVHRIHHENKVFWPFHSVHHSAEVMTPLTVYRKHPLYDLIAGAARGVSLGLAQGLALALFEGDPQIATLVGINAGYALFNLAGSNLRHTHIWLSYGPVLERLLISPAQHQIHHSSAPRHHDRNYGEVLAVWDWMFGTLYVPEREEILEFGLADAEGNKLPQRHDTLAGALIAPVTDALAAMGLRRKAPLPPEAWPGE
jgi:sterol desaturase/sphingolipid hydroxylase (fatty acid hydroxylase superfamily)